MNTSSALTAALGVLLFVAAAAFFYFGRRAGLTAGKTEELARQQSAKATAEETSKRIVGDAEREAENLRKSAVVAGKEELIKARESWETEARRRREELEREERRLQEKETQLDRKFDMIDQCDREIARRG